jgi:phosphoribosylformimino-5-aminoimidazole carboxamide ribotide isomerase
LDGAFGEDRAIDGLPINLERLQEIRSAVPETPIQYGGGLRSLAEVETALALGANRAILGTAALLNPGLVTEAVRRFGAKRIVAGIDARDGLVATHGWRQGSNTTAAALGRDMRERGVIRVVYTDISRDGMLSGVNAEATASLARETGLQVIASGGVATVEDVTRLRDQAHEGIEAVIVGQALYSGQISLQEAILMARGPVGKSAEPSS